MRVSGWAAVWAFGLGAACAGAQGACVASALPLAGKGVATVRQALGREHGPGASGAVNAAVSAQLEQMKRGLTAGTIAAFRCASTGVSAEAMQRTLQASLAATAPGAAGSGLEGEAGEGRWGGDLAVQVFSLFDKPRVFEVDFRWDLPCGDDHLLMIFETPSERAGAGWRETMQWTSPKMATVSEALGDFLVLAPMTGSVEAPQWHFAVAHGRPACASVPRASEFTLNLLTPTADPEKPRVNWQFSHPYTQDSVEPSLLTTEDTLVFRMVHRALADGPANAPVPAPEVYRFQLRKDGGVTATAADASSGAASAP